MNRKTILAGIALLTIIMSSLLLASCPSPAGNTIYGVKVTGDGSGGAFAVYEDELGGFITAQKISPDGQVEWGKAGFRIGDSHKESVYSYSSLRIAGGNQEEAVIAWPSLRSSDQPDPMSWIVKINSGGGSVFDKLFPRVDQMVSDGSGDVIFDYTSEDNDIYITRIDSRGEFPWSREGVLLTNPGNAFQLAGDGFGGAVIVREELHYPEEALPGETFSSHSLYVQKIDPDGNNVWGDEGIHIYTTPEDMSSDTPKIIADGSGGAIIAWHQQPVGRLESGSAESLGMDIFVQKVDAEGTVLWREGGLPLEINRAAADAFPTGPKLVTDGSGGAIIIWRDAREATSIYAQRIDADGEIRWQPGGVRVAATSLNLFPVIADDGAGGAIVSYLREEGLCAQRINADGETVWPENGVRIVDGEHQHYSAAPDGRGGLIVGWGTGKGFLSSEKAYIQRVNADGQLAWGKDGIKLNP